MRRQHTLLALAFAAMAFEVGNMKVAANVSRTANNSMGNYPFYNPTKSQRVKNKLNRLRNK